MNNKINDIDVAALDALIKRVQEAKAHGLALSSDDCQLLLDALCTLSAMQENLASKDITLYKLKKLVGMVQSSEHVKSSLVTQRPPVSDSNSYTQIFFAKTELFPLVMIRSFKLNYQ